MRFSDVPLKKQVSDAEMSRLVPDWLRNSWLRGKLMTLPRDWDRCAAAAQGGYAALIQSGRYYRCTKNRKGQSPFCGRHQKAFAVRAKNGAVAQ